MRVLLIDGFNLIRRLYEARPHDNESLDEEVINSSVQSLRRALSEHNPSHVCCVFDSHTSTWRHQLYPAYKANRKPAPAALLEALPRFTLAFEKEGVRSIEIDGLEADDIIASMAVRIRKRGGQVIILSTDKSFLQLLDDNVSVYDHFEGATRDKDWVGKKFGVNREQLVDYWSLTGDSTINVKGVPGIGPKNAQKLLGQVGRLDALLSSDSPDPMIRRVKDHAGEANLSRELVKLKDDVELGINLNQYRYLYQSH